MALNNYEKVLKELLKGNAVLLEITKRGSPHFDKLRIVTPGNCVWNYLDLDDDCIDPFTRRSCFLSALKWDSITPQDVMQKMLDYDSSFGYGIKSFQVLE